MVCFLETEGKEEYSINSSMTNYFMPQCKRSTMTYFHEGQDANLHYLNKIHKILNKPVKDNKSMGMAKLSSSFGINLNKNYYVVRNGA